MTWAVDVPSGVMKNRALSEKIYAQAVANSKLVEYATPVEGFGKKQGDTVSFKRIAGPAEPSSAKLTEGEPIPEDTTTISTASITVSEYGRSIPYTSLMEDLADFDVNNVVQKELVKQMTLVLDTIIATAFKKAKVKYAVTGIAANNIATNGTFGATSVANLNVWHLGEIRDYMYDTLFVPPIGDAYIGVFRSLALRGIKNDPDFIEWNKYTTPEKKYTGEVGMIEGIRLIEVNHSNAFGKVGTGSVLGEGVVFGDEAIALAEVLTPELRAKIPTGYGRDLGVAWYGILEAGLIWDTGNAGQAKILHVGSL